VIRPVTVGLVGWGPAAGDQEPRGERGKPVMEPVGELELLCLGTGTEIRRVRNRAASTCIREMG